MPQDAALRARCEAIVAEGFAQEGIPLLGWRDVPVNNEPLPEIVLATEPFHRQVFVARPLSIKDETAFERALYLARRVIANRARAELGPVDVQNFYIVTLSCRTIVYKGMFLSYQISLGASTGRVEMASADGANLEGGFAEVPRIIREYCEGESLTGVFHSRFVVNSLIGFTNSGTGLAARENDVPRGRFRAEELALCSTDP